MKGDNFKQKRKTNTIDTVVWKTKLKPKAECYYLVFLDPVYKVKHELIIDMIEPHQLCRAPQHPESSRVCAMSADFTSKGQGHL